MCFKMMKIFWAYRQEFWAGEDSVFESEKIEDIAIVSSQRQAVADMREWARKVFMAPPYPS